MAQTFMKRLYGPFDMARFIRDLMDSFADLKAARRNPVMGDGFSNRLLLAVTHVNGCRLCSYYHTKLALEEGMSPEEVAEILSGEFGEVPEREHAAILFAEHYAESAGTPSDTAVAALVRTYGQDEAAQILAVVRMIMVGNLHGNMLDALRHRMKRQAVEGSSLMAELGVILGPLVMLPLALLRRLFGHRGPGLIKTVH